MNINRDSRIAVIGYGSWATAIVHILTSNGHQVNWYVRNREIIESIVGSGLNCKYLSDVELATGRITVSDDLNAIVERCGIIFMAMPSAYVKTFLEPLTVSLDGKFIVCAIKGTIPGEYLTPSEYFHEHYNLHYSHIGVISGPTHAEEVSHGKTTYISVACKEEDDATFLGGLIENNYMRVSYSSDIYGMEYAAILKNIYAIAAGIASGLGYGDNFLAVLVADSAMEMEKFLSKTNPTSYDRFIERNFLGDLLVTCYSNYSRNRRLGVLIGRGCTVKSALNEMTMVAEGYFAAEGFHHILQQYDIEMPIARMVYDILYAKDGARKAMKCMEKIL